MLCLVAIGHSLMLGAQTDNGATRVLKLQLSQNHADTARVRIWESLAWEYRSVNIDSTRRYATLAIQKGLQTLQYQLVAYSLSHLADAFGRSGHLLEAEQLQRASIRLRQYLGEPKDLASGYNQLAIFFRDQGRFKESIDLLKKGLACLPQKGAGKMRGMLLDNLGINHVALGEFPEAIRAHRQAILLLEADGHPLDAARCHHNLGLAYQQFHRLQQALVEYDFAIEIYQQEGSSLDAAKLLGNEGMLYFEQGKQDSALQSLLLCRLILESSHDSVLLSDCYNNIALVHRAMNHFPDAVEYQLMDLRFCKSRNLKAREMVSSLNLADLYLQMGQHMQALTWTDHAVAAAPMNPQQLLELYQIRSNAYAALKDFKQSLHWLGKRQDLQDSLASVMSELQEVTDNYERERVLRLKAEHVSDVKEVKIAQIRAENRNQRLLILGGFGLAIAAGVIAVLQISRQRLRLRTMQAEQDKSKAEAEILKQNEEVNRLLQEAEVSALRITMSTQERERKRIAMNLHDGVGSKLSLVQMLFQSMMPRIGPKLGPDLSQYEKAVRHLDEACDEVRSVARKMKSGDLALFGLQLALEKFAEQICESGKLDVRLEVEGVPQRLDPQQEQEIYAVVNTLIANTIRHAQASLLTMWLRFDPEQLYLRISDNGVGFDFRNTSALSGIGLQNARERIETLGGFFKIESFTGKGTEVQLGIPYPKLD